MHRAQKPEPCSADADHHDIDNNERHGVDHAPTFTAENERQERAGLTVQDICEIEADLRGLVLDDAGGVRSASADSLGGPTSGISSVHDQHVGAMSTKSGDAPAANDSSAHLLSKLEEEMNKLERKFKNHAQSTDNDIPCTAAYRRAQRLCPDQLTDERLLAFLETEKGNAAQAARRLARYWNYRLDLFGESRCYRPMTLLTGGAMGEEVENLSVRRIYEPLPGNMTDEAGRSIVHCVPSRRNFAEYSVAQEMQALFYICETIIQDPIRRRAGLVAIMDGRNMRRQHFSRDMRRYSSIFKDVLPIKLRAHHLCYPSAIHYYVIVPASKFLSPRENRLRFVMHCGSEEHVLHELAMYRLPRQCIPTSLGGTAILDMNQWVLDRLVTEQREAVMATAFTSEAIPPPPSNTQAHADGLSSRQNGSHSDERDGPMTKRVRLNNKQSAGAAASIVGPPSSRPPDDASHSDGKRSSGRPRGRGAGRGRSDPRMDRAIKLKFADPDMSLMDALIGGGFVFNGEEEGGEIIDMDGVRLTQRKNNLVRRIRLEKKKAEEKNVEKRQEGTGSEQTSGRESGSSTEENTHSRAGYSSLTQNNTEGVGHVENEFGIANKSRRRDSFDEAILGLAGIQDIIEDERHHSRG